MAVSPICKLPFDGTIILSPDACYDIEVVSETPEGITIRLVGNPEMDERIAQALALYRARLASEEQPPSQGEPS